MSFKILVLFDAENINIHKGYRPTKWFVFNELNFISEEIDYFASYRVVREKYVNKSLNSNIRVKHCEYGKNKADEILIQEAIKSKEKGCENIVIVTNDKELQRELINLFGENKVHILDNKAIEKYKTKIVKKVSNRSKY